MADPVVVRREELKRYTPPHRTHPTSAARLNGEPDPTAFFSRSRDIVAATCIQFLDRAERPAQMLRLVEVEMEEALVENDAKARRLRVEHEMLRCRLRSLAEAGRAWRDGAALALDKNREDLARAALAQTTRAGVVADNVLVEIAMIDEALAECAADEARLTGRLEEIRVRRRAVRSRNDAHWRKARSSSDERVAANFARWAMIERRADFAGGSASAIKQDAAAELVALAIGDRVETDLAPPRARRAGLQEG